MEFLRNSSTGGPEAHPLWDSDTHVLAVPGVDDPRYMLTAQARGGAIAAHRASARGWQRGFLVHERLSWC